MIYNWLLAGIQLNGMQQKTKEEFLFSKIYTT